MKIKELYIYGFGRFENERFSFDKPQIQVIYGKNESGKSTILAYIEYMLFGFPKRSEKRLRYEPKTTQAYGGKMMLETEKYGLITIERKGDRTVHIVLEDGTHEDESLLKQILPEVNQLTYLDIFSFNLDGLQRIDQIKSEELGNYLFNAAMTGAQELNRISTYLEEQQSQLFKPNGKNPVLNQKLAQLIEQDRNLQGWVKKLDEYNRIKTELGLEQSNLKEQEQSHRELECKRKELVEIQSVAPLIVQKVTLQNQLDNHPNAIPFPENGLDRFRNWQERKVEAEGEWNHLQELKDRKLNSLKELVIDEALLVQADEIEHFEKSYQQYKVRKSDYQRLKQRIAHIEEEVETEKNELGENWTNDRISAAQTDIVAKQQIKQQIKEFDDLQYEQKTIDADLQRAKDSIEERERQLEMVDGQLVSDEKKRSYEEKLNQITVQSPSQLKQHLDTLKQVRASSKKSFINPILTVAMVVIGLILVSIWLYRGDVIEGIILGVTLVGSGIALYRKNSSDETNELDEQIRDLEAKLSNFESENVKYQGEEIDVIQKLLEKQQHLSFRKQQLIEESTQLERRYQDIAAKYDAWEVQFHKKSEILNNWRERFFIPASVSNEMVLEVLERVEQLKKRINDLEKLIQEAQGIRTGLERFEKDANRLAQLAGIQEEGIESVVTRLVLLLKAEKIKSEQKQRIQTDIHALSEQQAGIQKKVQHYEQECNALFEKAEVSSEESFWAKGKVFDSYQSLKEQLRLTESQLYITGLQHKIPFYMERVNELSELEQKIEETGTKMNELDEAIESGRTSCARLRAHLTHLEEDGSYSDLMHKIQVAKSEFHDQAKKWAVYRTADYLLNQAKQNYQSKRQPGVLKSAEEYFRRLTDGEYIKLIAPKSEESFWIERNDTILFRPDELSRATAEQLYLALRFALAKEYDSNKSFPFIMDDILVNFDELRRKRAVELIKSIAEDRQVIYFTCDRLTARAMADEPILLESVSSNPLPILR
ncbi:AAA family ATPase [Alkalihalobacillus sp. AL-G]|uniref:AAA family ATPase n=1 Tax=Alkalihalobacillus sp. AL-G TaxID=2926399 RepID=UPI00272A3A49|nr:AAA family ATPase [Alkalihalobacillus sp. AL-G]WLD94065.1 AAA family ATPase [Alkalihalobacillus sp. AL-G]